MDYKPAAFVSYGGISGGMRGVQATKPTLSTLMMVPILEGVTIPLVSDHLEDGSFKPSESHQNAAAHLLSQLHRWAVALKPMRNPLL